MDYGYEDKKLSSEVLIRFLFRIYIYNKNINEIAAFLYVLLRLILLKFSVEVERILSSFLLIFTRLGFLFAIHRFYVI